MTPNCPCIIDFPPRLNAVINAIETAARNANVLSLRGHCRLVSGALKAYMKGLKDSPFPFDLEVIFLLPVVLRSTLIPF
ncbi:MAG: hypothetical protein WAM54_09015 [Nitrososphaeraceae archaeon]